MNKTVFNILSISVLLLVSTLSVALPFTVLTKSGTTLPTAVAIGSSVQAYYTVTNNTASTRSDNYVKYLPTNVTQVTSGGTYGDTCGATFTLASHASCTLQLSVTGAVNASDPNPQDHLFVCLPGGTACAGTPDPLNVTTYTTPFTIVTKSGTTLPTTVATGGSRVAYYTLTNVGASALTSNYVKYLPSNVTQVTSSGTYSDTCGATFDLAANGQVGDSCTLQLTITGAVDANDPNPTHHLFACLSDDTTCAGTTDSLNVTVRSLMAYITAGTTVTYCSVNSSTGVLSSCVNASLSTLGLSAVQAIAINSDRTKIYVGGFVGTLQRQGAIAYCSINSNGSIVNDCSLMSQRFGALVSTSNFGVRGIAITNVGTMAYLTNWANTGSAIYSCPINSNGSLDTCIASSPQTNPKGIALNPANTQVYTGNDAAPMQLCSINSNGIVTGSCTSLSSSVFAQPYGVAINAAGTLAYITDLGFGDDRMGYCTINQTNGVFTACFLNTITNLPGIATGVALNPANTFLYLTGVDITDTTVTYCSVNSSDGSLSACATTGSGISGALGIAIG